MTLSEQATARSAAIGLPSSGPRATPDAAAAGTLTLSPRARSSCPAAATACVDLNDHLTWLQSDGHITYGPVSMEPGPPGTQQATPRGTFHVLWKAGANYISTEYHVPIPYAVFFAPGGVAFHGGSLTTPSHGCVHLDIGSARYYHDHLPAGAEVMVF
jgi:lipoprotein-anchoring transpeptidase ErfK/SrfK